MSSMGTTGGPPVTGKQTVGWTAIVAGCLVALFLICVLMVGGCKAFNRYQKRQDAENNVRVTNTLIQKEHQQVAVEAQVAQQKVAEARGIRESQDIINQTLTPLYVQHEAVQAQEAAVTGENHTEIYVPSGNNGVPLVKPVTP